MCGIMTVGIYKITNLINGKGYVGQSVDVEYRIRVHKSSLRGGYHRSKHLQSAWNKYGEENFEFELIKECEVKYLDELEIFYIQFYDAMNPEFGYNNESGGNTNKTMSPESKKKNSEAHTSTGFYLVSKIPNKTCKRGFTWAYRYRDENGKPTSIMRTDLSELEEKVNSEGLPWEILDAEKAVASINEDKQNVSETFSRLNNTTGFFRVSKKTDKKCKQGFTWSYRYTDGNGKRKIIKDVSLSKLMLKVTMKDLPWRIGDIDKALDTIDEINKMEMIL